MSRSNAFRPVLTLAAALALQAAALLWLAGDAIDPVAQAREARRGDERLGPRERRFEVHLFDYQGDLYGEELQVRFVARLRGEQKFSGLDELRAQLGRDAEAAQFRQPRVVPGPIAFRRVVRRQSQRRLRQPARLGA